jgi:hypothetical protein
MSENKMGNRGSKSDLKYKSVKEQRVDGSYFGSVSIPRLRCTLMGGESSYQIKIPSKQLNRGNKYYSSNSYFKSTYGRTPLDPYFVSGFSDAEASFIILISKEPTLAFGASGKRKRHLLPLRCLLPPLLMRSGHKLLAFCLCLPFASLALCVGRLLPLRLLPPLLMRWATFAFATQRKSAPLLPPLLMRSGHKLRCLLPLRLLPLRCVVKSKGAKSKAKGKSKAKEGISCLPFAFAFCLCVA